MTVYSYIYNEFGISAKTFNQKLDFYIKQQKLNLLPQNKIFEIKKRQKHWLDKSIASLLNKLKSQDTLVIYNSTHFARSAYQVYQIFNLLQQKQINLHVIDYNINIKFEKNMKTKALLELCGKTEDGFISRRTTEAVKRKNCNHTQQKSKNNNSFIHPEDKAKLDKNSDNIMHYINLKISKLAIAKLVECKPKTLSSWLENQPECILDD